MYQHTAFTLGKQDIRYGLLWIIAGVLFTLLTLDYATTGVTLLAGYTAVLYGALKSLIGLWEVIWST